jgi:hypothetical protein
LSGYFGGISNLIFCGRISFLEEIKKVFKVMFLGNVLLLKEILFLLEIDFMELENRRFMILPHIGFYFIIGSLDSIFLSTLITQKGAKKQGDCCMLKGMKDLKHLEVFEQI